MLTWNACIVDLSVDVCGDDRSDVRSDERGGERSDEVVVDGRAVKEVVNV